MQNKVSDYIQNTYNDGLNDRKKQYEVANVIKNTDFHCHIINNYYIWAHIFVLSLFFNLNH